VINPDVEARRMLVREHRAELARDALQAGTPKPDVGGRGAEKGSLRLLVKRSLFRLRLTRRGSLEPRDSGRSLLEEH
jgi:hypothetical protein